jgi:hypothetical protein
VKEEEDDGLSLPGHDTEMETDGQTHYPSGRSAMHVTGREERALDNGDVTGTNMKAQFTTYLLGQSVY